MIAEFERILTALVGGGVEFILIGGLAAAVHGSIRATEDVDIVYRRTPENIERLVKAIAPFNPYLRGVPPGLPFKWDQQTISKGLNFTLSTSLGALDLLGEVSGGGIYENLLPYCQIATIFGLDCNVVSLERLIVLKRAAGRGKDILALAELEALLSERDKNSPPRN